MSELGRLLLLCLATATNIPQRYSIGYATYFGGSEYEEAREIQIWEDGSILVGGQTYSTNLPVTPGAFQKQYGGEIPGAGHPGVSGGDCFLVRLSPGGKTIVAATYFGGSLQERNVYGMERDRQGNIIIASATRSPNLPTSRNAWRPRYAGGKHDSAVAKLTPDLQSLLWCTYLAGVWARGGIAVDKHDNIYVGCVTDLPDFPATPGVVMPRRSGPSDSGLIKLRPDGTGVEFATLLGGSGRDDTIIGIRVSTSGDIYVAGHTQSPDFPTTPGAAQSAHGGASDCYVARLSSDAARLIYSTYLGGTANEFAEHRLALLADGSILVTGATSSPDFPTTPGAFQTRLQGKSDGFLAKISADGKKFLFSTYIGGSGTDFVLMPTVDAEANIYIVGQTSSPDFPVSSDAFQPRYGGGGSDGVFVILSFDGSRLIYSTFLGGEGDDIIRSLTLDSCGDVYLVGRSSSTKFPITNDAVQQKIGGKSDAFVVRLVRSGEVRK